MKKNPSHIRVSIVQQTCTADKKNNLAASIKRIKEAARQGADLVLLQELHTNLYFCQTEQADLFDLAETIPGSSTNILSQIAKECQIIIVASLFEKRAVGLYHNTAVVFEKNGEIAGCYRKMHIPDDPGYYEKFYFTPGDLGFKPITTSIGKLGVLVCWDQWYPEAARLMTLAGADLLLYPTAIGWGSQEHDAMEKERQHDAWAVIQRSHAVANGLTVLVANRIGFESATPGTTQGIQFWGSSFIAGPQGEIISQANREDATLLLADINLDKHESVRRGWPFLRDRRIENYQDITRRYID